MMSAAKKLILMGGTFLPSRLFASSEVGAWYDPSDLTTLFQDSAGTTPVTAAGDPVGLMLDKSKGLALGSELVINGTFDNNVNGWSIRPATQGIISWNNGVMRFERQTGLSSASSQLISSFVVGRTYKISALVRAVSGAGGVGIQLRSSDGGGGSDLSLSVTTTSTTFVTQTVYWVATQTTGYISLRASSDNTIVEGDNISVREIAGNHATASGTTRPTYQVSGGRSYLSFDGVDDFMLTGTITPGTDKVQVFTGVRKLSDAATGVVAEFSVNIGTTAGSWALYAPSGANARYGFGSGGTIDRLAETASVFASPLTSVLTGIGDISGDVTTLRVNGVQSAQSTSDQGTGNYLAYPLYIGRRGGASLPYNGNLYGLIVRFGPNLTDAVIGQTENWLNQRTGAY